MAKSFIYEYIPDYAKNFLYYCRNIKNMSEKTVNEYYLDLRIFFRYLKIYKTDFNSSIPFNEIDASDVKIDVLEKINLTDLYEYLNYINIERNENVAARNRKISSLKSFFKYLCKQGLLDNNPTTYLDAPKKPKELPIYLSIEECMALLENIDGTNKIRNYAIITLFLNCGLRLSELVNINIKNITGTTLRVVGKGNKTRDVHLNSACINAINEYLKIRPNEGISYEDRDALFISRHNKRISRRMVQTLVSNYIEKANLSNEKYSTHKLRHTAATLMHQNGVDIRVLQEILGHENLGTTQIYTHLESKQIQDAMEKNPLNSIKPPKAENIDLSPNKEKNKKSKKKEQE